MAYKGMGQIDKKELWTIPNILTNFRSLCIPSYILLMLGLVQSSFLSI